MPTPGAPPSLTPEQITAAATAAARKANNQHGFANLQENIDGIDDYSVLNLYESDATDIQPPLKRTKMSVGDALVAELLQHKQPREWNCVEGCTFVCPSEAMLLDHWRNDCAKNTGRSTDDKKPKLADLEITIKNRTIGNETDDNNMRLIVARCWSLPANWLAHQALAIKGQKSLVRWNYDWQKLGLLVKNKKLIVEIHDTTCEYPR